MRFFRGDTEFTSSLMKSILHVYYLNIEGRFSVLLNLENASKIHQCEMLGQSKHFS